MTKLMLKGVLLCVAIVFSSSPAWSFGGSEGGCGAGSCSDCHSLSAAEASSILSGLVEKVHSVDFAIVPGLWKVEVEGQGQKGSVFIDFSKSYAISGRVLRLADWTDVSDAAASAAPEKTTADFTKIPLQDALVVGSREAKHKIVVFTDPQCPFCVKLHEEIRKIVAERKDVAFYLILYPLKSHPDAYRISKSVVCSASLEMLEESYAGKAVADPSCETDAVDRGIKVAEELGVRSTPTLVFEDGSILPGFKPAAKLLEILGKISPQP